MVSQENIGKPLAIVVDGTLVSAPVIKAAIPGGVAVIVGSFTQEEAERIADGIVGR